MTYYNSFRPVGTNQIVTYDIKLTFIKFALCLKVNTGESPS